MEALVDLFADFFHFVGDLRDQDHVAAAGQPRFQGDPARVAAHHFDDHDPVVGFGRGMQLVDGHGGGVERRVKAEGDIGAVQVVVDGLGNADDGQAVFFKKKLGDALRAVAADGQQHVDPVAFDGLHGLGRHVPGLLPAARRFLGEAEGIVAVGGSQDGTAPGQDPRNVRQLEFADIVVDQAGIAVEDAADLDTEFPPGGIDHGADDRVQTRAIAAPGQDPQFPDFFHLLSSLAIIAKKNTLANFWPARNQLTPDPSLAKRGEHFSPLLLPREGAHRHAEASRGIWRCHPALAGWMSFKELLQVFLKGLFEQIQLFRQHGGGLVHGGGAGAAIQAQRLAESEMDASRRAGES